MHHAGGRDGGGEAVLEGHKGCRQGFALGFALHHKEGLSLLACVMLHGGVSAKACWCFILYKS